MQENVMVILLPRSRERSRMKPDLVFFGSMSGSLDHAVALEIFGETEARVL